MQPNIDIADVLRRGFNLYKENITTLIVAGLLAMVISVATVGILAGPMAAGLVMITLGLADRKDPKPEVGDLFKGFTFFVPTLVFVILAVVAQLLGQTILKFLPIIGPLISGLYAVSLNTVLMFVIFYIVDRKMDVVAAIQQSFETVKVNFWIFLAINILAGVISALGVIACGIGIVVTAPIGAAILTVVYRDVHPIGTQDSATPTVN